MDSAGGPRTVGVGRVLGLEISFVPSVAGGALLAVALFGAAGYLVFHRSLRAAIAGGLALLVLHMASELFHNLGHATAARAAGHPMIGVRFWGPLATSVYPHDEPELAPAVHVRRALGGPAGSAVLTVVAGILWLLLGGVHTVNWILLLFFLDNLLVFTLGAFLPLGFTDGSTLLRYARRS